VTRFGESEHGVPDHNPWITDVVPDAVPQPRPNLTSGPCNAASIHYIKPNVHSFPC
jgi:hypothetical protein